MCNSISCSLDQTYIGKLNQISLINKHGKKYYFLKSQIPIQTILVGVKNESFTPEIQVDII